MEKIFANLKEKDSLFAAYSVGEDHVLLAEGKTPDEVIAKADESGEEYIVSFVPRENHTYIF